jgi:hypothetical protein
MKECMKIEISSPRPSVHPHTQIRDFIVFFHVFFIGENVYLCVNRSLNFQLPTFCHPFHLQGGSYKIMDKHSLTIAVVELEHEIHKKEEKAKINAVRKVSEALRKQEGLRSVFYVSTKFLLFLNSTID